MSSEQRYQYTTIPAAPSHRKLMEDFTDPPGHAIKYRKRRDKTVAGPKGTKFLPMCTCGAKSDHWYDTKPKGKKLWFKLEHLPEVRLQVAFPGIQEVTNPMKGSNDV